MTGVRSAAEFSFAFLSTNKLWGGSEELWSRTALALADAGHRVVTGSQTPRPNITPLDRLEKRGVRHFDLRNTGMIPFKIRHLIDACTPFTRMTQAAKIDHLFRSARPDLVIISQGLNYEGWQWAERCRQVGLSYVLISQKADDMHWPRDEIRRAFMDAHRGAVESLFVSNHNLRLTEEQIAGSLPNARVVANPFLVPWAKRDDWPDTGNGFRLACVARLDTVEKGQAALLRVLAQPKWRERPLRVSFYGAGPDAEGLREMARYLDVERADFPGFIATPERVWDDHHGLVLCSRCEGLPLAVVETMLSGRVAVITPAGGGAEVIEHGRTGFVAAGHSEFEIDAILEEAWASRDDWQAIGEAAGRSIRTQIPSDPSATLAAELSILAARQGAHNRAPSSDTGLPVGHAFERAAERTLAPADQSA
ncbi:glycosyltransferase family 4 protein [Sphingomonas immobilis]|uniref:Glycosyltransferase family 4 protein n=1 Tax=Sphingomonas immobilis TaxID=3063997 RepID=A0ABT8ZWA9_9SPHN|nr:glycosyltransferase family 4 protein [Sphingomonas sp. CA1-15]MDO7841839.1 glycosyltransferase family 4 protein [Sphingomonas sp. CA1-15]